jgi:hypothetical protein
MFQLHCDRCHRFIKYLKQAELSDFKRGDPVVCGDCQSTERKMVSMVENLKQVVKTRTDDMIAKTKEELQQIIRELVKERERILSLSDGKADK